MEGYEYTIAEQIASHNNKNTTLAPTIIADDKNVGIAIRTIKEFFKQKSRLKDHLKEKFFFYVSFFQIYNEKVYDLLDFDSAGLSPRGRKPVNDLRVRWNNKDGFTVENLFLFECAN